MISGVGLSGSSGIHETCGCSGVDELVINLKSAKTLGLTIPQSVLLRANEIIE